MMINKIKGIINEFLFQHTLLFLFVKGETGSGKTHLIRAFQNVYVQKNGYQSMIYLQTPLTRLIKHFYHAILTAVWVTALKEWSETYLREKLRSVLMNNQVKAIIVDDFQNVSNGKKSVEFLEIMNWLTDSTSTKIHLFEYDSFRYAHSKGPKILELQTA